VSVFIEFVTVTYFTFLFDGLNGGVMLHALPADPCKNTLLAVPSKLIQSVTTVVVPLWNFTVLPGVFITSPQNVGPPSIDAVLEVFISTVPVLQLNVAPLFLKLFPIVIYDVFALNTALVSFVTLPVTAIGLLDPALNIAPAPLFVRSPVIVTPKLFVAKLPLFVKLFVTVNALVAIVAVPVITKLYKLLTVFKFVMPLRYTDPLFGE